MTSRPPTRTPASACIASRRKRCGTSSRTPAPRHTEVRLARIGERIELTVADDGRGFDIGQASDGVKGLGLVSINERVRLAGGTVSFMTEVNKGTRVRVDIPAGRRPAVATRRPSDPYAASA